jgi:hypothetical protein
MNKYDNSEGRRLRDEGAAKVSDNTCNEWVMACDGVIASMAANGSEFTAEDVRDFCGDPPHHHNAMGARFLTACKHGVIVKVGYTNSRRKRSHAATIAVYKGKAHACHVEE